ncbi:long chain acyl-CoA synthetase 6, peroxisomal [Cyclospora cayetanensis]|nr:long chain acyl-CoA synthetase 6, peroxisomal [Cyclospora cayetanensis]
MHDLFEECAVLAADATDEAEVKRVSELLEVKDWKGVYALPIPGTETNETSAVYRCVKDPSNPDVTQFGTEGIPQFPHVKSPYMLMREAARIYGRALYLGERFPIRNEKGEQIELSNFKYFTFADTLRVVEALGRALDQEVGVSLSEYEAEGDSPPPSPMRILGIWSRSRMDWRLVDFAASYRGIVTVPLYDTLGEESLNHIITKTKMEVMAVEGSKLPSVLRLKESGYPLKAIISFDPPTEEQFQAFEAAGMHLFHQEKLRRKYLTIADTKTPDELKPSLADVSTIIFTSGTTGLPKGAVHTNGSLLSFVGSYMSSANRMRVSVGDSTLSYLPLAHIYQREVELVVTLLGIRIAYFSGDLLRMPEDLQLARPSIFIGVPRVFGKILTKINSGIKEKHPLIQWLAGKALDAKKHKYAKDPTSVSGFIPDLLFKKVRATFGGNIRTLSMGSAPMDSEQLKELQLYLSAFICEGWGMTESGIAFLQDAADGNKGTIGGPLASTEYKVISLPALQYDARQSPPRGELLVRGPCLVKEYFLDSEKTKDLFDKDGWLHTGDVVEIQLNGAVKIIDRAKNIFKLAHGEYVAPERLENIYSNSPWVDQIFVYGDSLEAALVAVVVPSGAAIQKWADDNGKSAVPTDKLLSDRSLKEQILRDLETLGRQQLKGFEIIKGVHLTSEHFTVENGLVTPTMKVIRSAARDKYLVEIKQLYNEIAQQQAEKAR